MSAKRPTRDMTLRVYTVNPDGTTTEVVPRHVAARSISWDFQPSPTTRGTNNPPSTSNSLSRHRA
ncbi:hypothetical protein OG216_05400 [Streptomycetaceae bacterium NBC_01309]